MGNEERMCDKVCEQKPCGACPMGFFSKKVFGVSVGVWLLAFAVLPQSARGVAWTVRSVGGLWDGGPKAVMQSEEGPRRRRLDG